MWEPRVLDYLIWFFLFLLFLGVVFIFSKFKKTKEYNLLTIGFVIKALGGLSFALIYIYYYGYGDTFRYFGDSQKFVDVVLANPLDVFNLYFSDSTGISEIDNSYKFHMYGQVEGWFMIKFTSIAVLLAAKSYLGTTLFLSFVSFLGSYKLYQTFNKISDRYKINFVIAFLIPSVLVWGTGILKDTFTLCSLNYLIFYSYKFIIEKKIKLWDLFFAAFHIYVLISLKSYIFISFLPTILILVYLNFVRNLGSSMLKILFVPIILSAIFVIGYFSINTIASNSVKYDIENVENTTEGFSSWHKSLGGSYYDVGEYDFTLAGILSISPSALNVTFFRPYFWETNSVFMLINAFESFVFFMIFLYIIANYRLRIFSKIFGNTFLFALLIFCFIFAIAVGITSYNFGALARYKMPVLSPFLMIMFYLINTRKQINGLK